MESKARNLIVSFVVVMLCLFTITKVSFAAEAESPVTCIEVPSPPQALAYGNHTTGCTIFPVTDTDQFTFSGTVNDLVRFNVMSTSTNMDPVLEVRDPIGNLIASGSCNNGSCTFSLDVLLPLSGSYLVTLYDSGLNEAGNYTMQMEKIWPAPVSQRLDYNSGMSDAVSPQTDVDHYNFNGTAGTSIRLNAFSTTTNMDPTIEVRDPNGTVVLNGAADGASCQNGSCTFSIDLLPALTGTYSLIIYDAGTNEAGNYQLSLWCILGDCDSDADGFIDNNREILNYGAVKIKDISPAVDGDFYLFQGTIGDLIQVVGFSATTNMDPTIEVYDPTGMRILNGAADGASCQNGGCSFSVNIQPAITGIYTLVLYDSGTDEAGRYNVSLNCIFSPGDFVCGDILTPPLVCDNCSVVSNPTQLDSNADGFGNICDADLSGDVQVNLSDYSQFRSAFGTPGPDADFNGDGIVNLSDYSIFRASFGKAPGPSCNAPNSP